MAPQELKIRVFVRKRPLKGKEVHQPQTEADLTEYLDHQKFQFDYTFGTDDDNRKVRFLGEILIYL